LSPQIQEERRHKYEKILDNFYAKNIWTSKTIITIIVIPISLGEENMKNLKKDSRTFSTIGTDTMRKKMGEVLDSVYFKGDEFIIERKAKPLAALVSIDKYNAMNKFFREFVLNGITKQNQNATGLSDQIVEDLANEAKHKSRQAE
jgi:prevent-host-death family protein